MSKITPIRFVEDVMKFSKLVYVNNRATRPDLEAGDARWMENDAGEIAVLNFICPCGCKGVHAVPISPGYGSSMWTFDGNKEQPTLSPSILSSPPHGCGWHGHLVKGEFIEC